MVRARQFALVGFSVALFLATSAQAQRITAVWQGQELATVLERIASTVQKSVWLDRRVDPHQPVNAQFTDVPFVDAIEQLANQHDLGVAQLGSLVYVGPKETASGLSTLSARAREALRRAPAAQRKRWLQTAAGSWPRLSEPRALLRALAQQANVTLVDQQLVPHDLWPARQLPPLALVDRVVLLLAGFDLTCELSPDGKTCRIVPLEYPLAPVKNQLLPQPRGSMNRKPPSNTVRQFTLQLENQPVGRVLDQLANQLKLELRWDEDSLQTKELSRETLVSCDVANADLDGLLRGILEPAGMAYSRTGERVEIHAAP